MNISNRALFALLIVTLFLVGTATALALTMSREAPPPPPPADEVTVVPSVIRTGGQKIATTGPLTVTVADKTVAESAFLTCDKYKVERPYIKGGMAFEDVPFGDCSLLLQNTTVAYAPVYPGDDLRCANENSRTVCTGGIATEKAGVVSVASALPGTLEVDGEDMGPLPRTEMRLKVGKRALVVHLQNGRRMLWTLVVQPEEKLEVSFPDPG